MSQSNFSDEQICDALLSGHPVREKAAIEFLEREVKRPTLAKLRKMGAQPEQAEELWVEALVVLCTDIRTGKLPPEENHNFKGYLYRTAYFMRLAQIKRQKRSWTHISLDQVLNQEGQTLDLPDEGPDTAERAFAHEQPEAIRQRLLAECISNLSHARQRSLLDARFRQGKKPAEIAKALGQKPEVIRAALSRARKALKACLERKREQWEEK